jgi:Fe-S cluster assembly protein SufD
VLTREAVEELSRRRQEPSWLLSVRLRAWETYERLPLPDQRTEGWRRTSLRGLPLDSFNPLLEQARRARLPDVSGASVMDLYEGLQDPLLAARIEKHFGNVVAPDLDKFTALHYAFFNAGVVVFVPRGRSIEAPVWISHEFDGSGESPLVHTLIIAEEQSDVRVVEDFRGGSGLASGVVEQIIGANAHVRYAQVQRFSGDVWNFSTQRAVLDADASLRTLNVAVGGRLSRNTVQVVLEGRGGQADLLGIAETRDRQHVDFQTLQDHHGDSTRSDLVIHNALRDRSSANFTGLIRINKSAHQTESSQEQKNILLSDQAKADSDPKLEILNNDVIRCTHGASVGPIDAESIFYLRSRGLESEIAERLIVEGFFQSVLQKVQMPAAEEAIWSAINQDTAAA